MLPAVDWSAPTYGQIFAERARRLEELRASPRLMQAVRQHYRNAPEDFVTDWGMTYDPRNLAAGTLASMPFVLWQKQRDYLQWVHARWRAGERGLVEKSRDCGVTWLSVGYACCMWLFEPGFSAGFGSRKAELVDKIGDPDSIFEKVRFFLDNLPADFMPAGWNSAKHCSYMKAINPENGASLTGEAGDNIGRGGRKSLYMVDEAAFIERQDLVDAALSQTTTCQIDISTPNGNGNAFFKKRMRLDGSSRLFVFDWRDDPRKNDAWYAKQCESLDAVIVAQEIDRDYDASIEDSFIPAKWVASAIDAHEVLGFEPVGIRAVGFDPADVGDAKAAVYRHGSVILEADELRSGDITDAIPWCFRLADGVRADVLAYDADGLGAPSMKLALQQRAAGRMRIVAYHGSAGVLQPDERFGGGGKAKAKGEDERLHDSDLLKRNADLFLNFRAQTWTWARERFRRTHEAVERARAGKLVNADPEDLISISSKCSKARELQSELSRPRRMRTPNGLWKVESKEQMRARGIESPNLADAAIIAGSVGPVATPAPVTPLRGRTHTMKDPTTGY